MKLLPLSLVFLATLPAQDVTFRATTSLVRIDAEAIDAGGRVIPNLKREDFRVMDQGAPQTLADFSFEEEPLDLILLFDTSSGMREKIHGILRATELGFHELREGDRVCVMAYGAESRVARAFTADLWAVNDAILLSVVSGTFSGGARIEKAAAQTALQFRAEPATHRKRAVIAITDKAESDRVGAASAVRELWDSNAVFSELIIGKGGQTRLLDAGAASIVDRTGGAAIAAGVPGEAFQESVHYVRSGYTMYYALPDAAPGSERMVKVELSPDAAQRFPGVRVRGRSGYVVPH
jgi:VWFA-related protein